MTYIEKSEREGDRDREEKKGREEGLFVCERVRKSRKKERR